MRSDCRRSLVTASYFTVRSSYPTPKTKEGAPQTGERRPGRPKYEVAKLSWMLGKKFQAFRHFEFCKHCREKGHSYHWSIAKLYFIAQPGWQAFVREGEGNLGARPRAMDWLSRLSRARNSASPPFQTSATQAIRRLILLGLVETVFFYFYINLILQLLFSQFFKSFVNSGAPAHSGAPWTRKFGKLSIPENLVMT